MLVFCVFASMVLFASPMTIKDLENRLVKKFDLDFWKDFFKFHLFVDPHPICALEDEVCTLDNNCCRNLECKISANREGVSFTCQPRIRGVNSNSSEEEETNEENVHWGFTAGEADTSRSLMHEVYRSRIDNMKKEEDKLLNDQYYMIKELRKPVGLEELRELQLAKELEDYQRERELQELREWAKQRDKEEAEQAARMESLRKLAKERVVKVLKEEERQKLEAFSKMRNDIQNEQNKN